MKEFKIGDRVIIYTEWHGYNKKRLDFKEDTIKSISPKKKEISLNISDEKFSDNGTKLGPRPRFSMSSTTLKLLTSDVVKELNSYTMRQKHLRILETIKWEDLSDDALISIMIAYDDAISRDSR